MRSISVLHQKHAPIRLGRMGHLMKGASIYGGLVSYGKRLNPEQYAMRVESSENISEGSGVRSKKLKPLKFRL